MRRLMWFTIGYTAACCLAVWMMPENWIPAVSFGAFMVSVGLFALKFNRKCRLAAFVLLGVAVGLCWFLSFQRLYLAGLSELDGAEQIVCIMASDYSKESNYGTEVDGRILTNDKSYRIRAYLEEGTSVEPGDTIEGIFRLRLTAPTDSSEGTYHAERGIFLLAYQRDTISVSEEGPQSWRYYPAVLSRRIEETIDRCFPEDTVSFAKALLLGKTGDISYELDTALKTSGIRHVVAVSGLHVAIVFGLLQLVSFKKPGIVALLGFPALLLFAALAGFTPSVNRACMMCGLMMLGKLLNQEYDGATALSFAVLVMLAVNPLAVTSVSLQLSVASVVGIFLFYEKCFAWLQHRFETKKKERLLKKLCNGLFSSVSITISATITTAPLCAIHFGAVSLIAVVTNLLTLWVISMIFYGILAVCAVYMVSISAAIQIASVISIPIRYVILCAKALGRFPLAAVYTRNVYIAVWLIFCYCLLVVFLLQKKKSPRTLFGCVIWSLLICITLSWTEPMMQDVRLTVLDVGQGQSILLQSEGRTYLVDCGGDSDVKTADIIAQTLTSQGLRYVDGIILTHYDRDHAGAISNLLTQIQTDSVYLPRTDDISAVPALEAELYFIDEDIRLSFGDASIEIYGSGYTGSGNENSLCILFERKNCAILITGDRSSLGERMLMRKRQLPKLDVLIAGHHGAEDSTCEELLQMTEPEIVMISVGADNIYGHPDPETLLRLKEAGCRIYRTDQNGTIVYRR